MNTQDKNNVNLLINAKTIINEFMLKATTNEYSEQF